MLHIQENKKYWANIILERGGIFTNLSKTDKASKRLFLNEFDY